MLFEANANKFFLTPNLNNGVEKKKYDMILIMVLCRPGSKTIHPVCNILIQCRSYRKHNRNDFRLHSYRITNVDPSHGISAVSDKSNLKRDQRQLRNQMSKAYTLVLCCPHIWNKFGFKHLFISGQYFVKGILIEIDRILLSGSYWFS